MIDDATATASLAAAKMVSDPANGTSPLATALVALTAVLAGATTAISRRSS